MTFDDAIDMIDVNGTLIDTLGVLQALQQEYAPTVEMTKSQKDLILRNQDENKLYEIMGDGDGYYFNAEYWGDLEPHEVASAYLHPETIEIIKPKKWFVVGRDYGAGADIPVLMSISGVIPQYSSIGFVEDIDDDCAYAFDTKEEANQWATPKMHAVEMEVE